MGDGNHGNCRTVHQEEVRRDLLWVLGCPEGFSQGPGEGGSFTLVLPLKQRQVTKGVCSAHDLRGGSGVGGAIGKEAAIR